MLSDVIERYGGKKPTSRKVYLMKLDTFAMNWKKNTNSNTTHCMHSLLEQRGHFFSKAMNKDSQNYNSNNDEQD